jgi:transposase
MNGQTDFTVKAERDDFKNILFLAMELSRATWLVATFAPRLGDKIGVHAIPGGDTKRLLELIGRLQSKLRGKGVGRVRTVCCYEAGCDGFWLHRVLVNHGIESHVLDAASLPIDPRTKHIKTDNIDAKRLLGAIVGLVQGDPQSCRVVRAPTPEEEDARRLHRERQRLVRERTGHLNRIKALLITHGIRALRITDAKWCERLDKMQTGDGRPIPARLKIEIEREWKRLKMVAEQVREVEAERDRLVKGNEPSVDVSTEKMRRLVKLYGIGAEFATVLTREVFYRPFAGNTRARVIAVQMAWLWLRYQSKSELSLWYYRRVGDLKSRVRRIMIIALARKLVIALRRYVDTGKVPTGAIVTA